MRWYAAVIPSIDSPAAVVTSYARRLTTAPKPCPTAANTPITNPNVVTRTFGGFDRDGINATATPAKITTAHPTSLPANRVPIHPHSAAIATGTATHCVNNTVNRAPSRGSAANTARSPNPIPITPLKINHPNPAPPKPPPAMCA